MVSGIIGKGGSVIKDIISRSGAEVKVSQKDPNNLGADRVVSITGGPQHPQPLLLDEQRLTPFILFLRICRGSHRRRTDHQRALS